MLRGYVLRHLGRVADGGIRSYEASRELPLLVRALVVRSASVAVNACAFETERANDDPHVSRLAYLRVVGVPAIDPRDEVGVKAQFDGARKRGVEASAGVRFSVSLFALVALAACADDPAPASQPPGAATVVRAVDGDTLVVAVGGREERVRLIGIDTPESVAEDRPVECFGPEASARTAELLPPGTAVRLEREPDGEEEHHRGQGIGAGEAGEDREDDGGDDPEEQRQPQPVPDEPDRRVP